MEGKPHERSHLEREDPPESRGGPLSLICPRRTALIAAVLVVLISIGLLAPGITAAQGGSLVEDRVDPVLDRLQQEPHPYRGAVVEGQMMVHQSSVEMLCGDMPTTWVVNVTYVPPDATLRLDVGTNTSTVEDGYGYVTYETHNTCTDRLIHVEGLEVPIVADYVLDIQGCLMDDPECIGDASRR